MRRPTILLAVLLAGLGATAHAQTAVVAKRRPAISAPPPPPPPAPTPSLSAASARLSLTGLPSSGDGGATCRSTCARTRYACEVQEESCGSQWAACLKTCSDAAAVPATALLPR